MSVLAVIAAMGGRQVGIASARVLVPCILAALLLYGVLYGLALWLTSRERKRLAVGEIARQLHTVDEIDLYDGIEWGAQPIPEHVRDAIREREISG